MSNATATPTQAPVEARPVYRPLVDVIDTADSLVLVMDLPGVDENETEVTLEKNLLTIRGTVSPPSFAGHTLAHAEYGVGNFERVFTVSEQVNRDQIDATVKDGVLRVTLPKAKQAAAQKIAVKAR